LRDVVTDRDFIVDLLDNLRHSAVIEEGQLRVCFLPTERFLTTEPEPIQSVRGISTEQSNSTSLVDDRYVVKMYRKMEKGVNPEVEMGRFLTDVAGFANTPALFGSVELNDSTNTSAVAIVHAYVENQGDTWSVTSAALDRYVDHQRVAAVSDTEPPTDDKATYQISVAQMAKRIAEMQLALASREDIADFEPVPLTSDDIRDWTAAILARADRALDLLAQATVNDRSRSVVDLLLERRHELRDCLSGLLPPSIELMKIRHHGDLHLGQMLLVRDDIFIIDFEGEPRRTLAERRMKAPAARDIAGLLRSIDYSTAAALDRALQSGADEGGRIAAALASWRDDSMRTFLAAYREAMPGAHLWPSDPATADRVLQFFLLEKAFYEIEYELAHRPDWIGVAVGGALRVLDHKEKV
jgi:maltose alpha-D-glucosyltransferase/alpha-amylase